MSDNNYKKENGQYNINNEYYDYHNANNYSENGYGHNDYQNNMNYENNYYNKNNYSENGYMGNEYNYYGGNNNYNASVDNNGMSYNNQNQWSNYQQGQYGYDNQYYTNYMNNEYNYDNEYSEYGNQYSIDYSNSSSNYINQGYDYFEYDNGAYQANFDSSIYEISNKLTENVNEEILYSSLMNQKNNNIYGQNNDPYDNMTVGMDMSNIEYINRKEVEKRNNLYRSNDRNDYSGINSNANYYHREDSRDNKLIPTEDIMYDDAYVVKNQLFEEEESLFSFNDLLSFLICIVFAVILAFLITRYVAQLTEVDGPSMSYNLRDKDDLLLDKFSYKVRKPKRYEIVVFPVDDNSFYIKRIIGLPGEKVDVYGAKYDADGNLTEKSKVFINGKELTSEVYGFENIEGTAGDNAHVTLGEDEYYVMGDNRNNSKDSRVSDLGAIKGSDFVGRAIFRVFPLNSFGPIDNRVNEKIYSGDTDLMNKYSGATN